MKRSKNKKKKVDDMEQFTFRLPSKDLKRLRKASKKHRLVYPTPSHMIRVFIERGLQWLEEEAR
jgi:hypothetical protein